MMISKTTQDLIEAEFDDRLRHEGERYRDKLGELDWMGTDSHLLLSLKLTEMKQFALNCMNALVDSHIEGCRTAEEFPEDSDVGPLLERLHGFADRMKAQFPPRPFSGIFSPLKPEMVEPHRRDFEEKLNQMPGLVVGRFVTLVREGRIPKHSGAIVGSQHYHVEQGQIVIGDYAQANVTFNQALIQQSELPQLATEIAQLRAALKAQNKLEDDEVIGDLARAERAARENDGSKVVSFLKAVGTRGLDVAQGIGVELLARVIAKSLGMPPT